ncbi:MAG: glycosyltransferase family 2 protein [Candidatus Aenigmarchaeota archaeon]|nr:glycosyltransferase family 2 protein [Candidatus Aenigmarchaeota archaeon]
MGSIKKTIAVGIITYNRHETLKIVLDALQKQTRRAEEIIVVDNSTNFETQKLLKNYTKVKYFHIKKRIYQPQARRIVLEKCNADIIAFLDDDAVPEPQWLASLQDSYNGGNVVGVTGPALNCVEPGKPAEKIIRSDKNRNYFTAYGDVRSDSRRWIPSKPVKCTIMLGANMSFLTEALRNVGFDGFYGKDAAFREETDPQVALVRQGFTFVYNPKAIVWHMKYAKGGIRSNPPENYYYYCGVNHRHFADKYFSRWRSRLSWIFWSQNPPCLWLALMLAVFKRDKKILKWHKGLWKK